MNHVYAANRYYFNKNAYMDMVLIDVNQYEIDVFENNEKIEVIKVNKATHEMRFNNGQTNYNVELPAIKTSQVLSAPVLKSASHPTINKKSAVNFNSNIPWKGSVIALAAVISAAAGGLNAMSVATTVASVVTADAGTLTLKFTQYRSNETYKSSYDGTHYHKVINKNVRIYYGKKRVYGPKDGKWFDPVRP